MSKTETMMRVRKSTLNKLKDIGEMGESYNDVIDRILKEGLVVRK